MGCTATWNWGGRDAREGRQGSGPDSEALSGQQMGPFTIWWTLGHTPKRREQAWGNRTPLLATLFGQLLRGPLSKLPETIVCATRRAELAESLWRRGTVGI